MCFPPLDGSTWGCSFSAGDIVAETLHWSLMWSLARTGLSSLQLGLSTHDGFHSNMRADPANRLLMDQTPPPFDCATQSVTYANSSFCCSTIFFFLHSLLFPKGLNFNHKVMNFGFEARGECEERLKRTSRHLIFLFLCFHREQGKLPLSKRRLEVVLREKHFCYEM